MVLIAAIFSEILAETSLEVSVTSLGAAPAWAGTGADLEGILELEGSEGI